MKNIIKLNVIFLAFFIVFSSKSFAAKRILPLPKPTVDVEAKNITAKKKEIYPKKKPEINKEEKQIETSEEIVKITTEAQDSIFIYPEKKQ